VNAVKFNEEFLFGASVSNYQHFGSLVCDFPLIDASKHSTYYETDFKILQDLGLNAFRTGVDWARIEPEEGKIDEGAIRFYHKYLSKLKETGVATIIDLYHIGNPKWIHAHGGWASEEIVGKFLQYVDLATREYDQYVDYYLVMNEPEPAAYVSGQFSSQFLPKDDPKKIIAASYKNMIEAIMKSYDIIHERNSEAKVGVQDNIEPSATVIEPEMEVTSEQKSEEGFGAFMEKLAHVADEKFDTQKGKFDYIGLNYYGMSISGDKFSKIMVYPEGLRDVCRTLWAKYRKPIIITENGLANRDYEKKTAFLVLHLKSLHDAITLDGAKVIGYCWWSFLPGWERFNVASNWYWRPSFELVDVDLVGNFERRPMQTAIDYGEIIKNHGFSIKLYERCLTKRYSISHEDWL